MTQRTACPWKGKGLPWPKNCPHCDECKTDIPIWTAKCVAIHSVPMGVGNALMRELFTDLREESICICLQCVWEALRAKGTKLLVVSGYIMGLGILAFAVCMILGVGAWIAFSLLPAVVGLIALKVGATRLWRIKRGRSSVSESESRSVATCLYLRKELADVDRVVLDPGLEGRLTLLGDKDAAELKHSVEHSPNPAIRESVSNLPEGSKIYEFTGYAHGGTYYYHFRRAGKAGALGVKKRKRTEENAKTSCQ